MSEAIPIVETYRAVGIHDFQPAERIADVVKPSIDAVYCMSDPIALADYAADSGNPPEARLFAAARCEAAWQLAAEDRSVRPRVDMVKVRVSVAGLDSLTWINPDRYTTLLDPSDSAPMRETPLHHLKPDLTTG